MPARVKIGDFIKLTGSTTKTIRYYHKIGLLPQPKRSASGYRLYGASDLLRMQAIAQLKKTGFDLPRIREILGADNEPVSLRTGLLSLKEKLLSDKQQLEYRLSKIEDLLTKEKSTADTSSGDINPSLYERQQKILSLLGDFNWNISFQEHWHKLKLWLWEHPAMKQQTLVLAARLAALAPYNGDEVEINALAKDAAAFVRDHPQLLELIGGNAGFPRPDSSLYDNMVETIIPQEQLLFMQFFRNHLRESS